MGADAPRGRWDEQAESGYALARLSDGVRYSIYVSFWRRIISVSRLILGSPAELGHACVKGALPLKRRTKKQ